MSDTEATADLTPRAELARSTRRKLLGVVRSDKPHKTVVVEVVREYVHRKYHKYVSSKERYQAHDETNQYRVGDTVEIQEYRPISKNKRWIVTRLVRKAK